MKTMIVYILNQAAVAEDRFANYINALLVHMYTYIMKSHWCGGAFRDGRVLLSVMDTELLAVIDWSTGCLLVPSCLPGMLLTAVCICLARGSR